MTEKSKGKEKEKPEIVVIPPRKVMRKEAPKFQREENHGGRQPKTRRRK